VVPTPTASPEVPVRLGSLVLNVDARVVEMGWEVVQTASGAQSEWTIPKDEAGHHINSAALGASGNVVLSGHNNIFGRVFEAISLAWDDARREKVDEITDRSPVLDGRKIQLYNSAGQRYDYTVAEFYRLKDYGVPLEKRVENARFMQPTTDTRLTLVTCWPIWSNTHRLVVIAKPAAGP